ncbi:MAG: thiolase family protein [Nanoarchaeota archaeon]|nr:thiolase family protein [Nanoarchaeota archaeon]MBU1704637.1 thiolase family protein [Nanoarchaeota archaeon]
MYVKGAGCTRYGIHDKPTHMLAYEAISGALKDADTSLKKIDAIVCGSIEWFYTGENQRHFAAMLSGILKTNVPIIRIPAACATGGALVWTANQLDYDNVLVVGAEKLHGHTRNTEMITSEFAMAAESKWEQPEGLIFPSENALVAQAYMKEFPETTMDDLALIALKNHENGYLNPNAFFYGKKVTLDDIRKSPIVTSPLRLFDCSISVDGAAATVLTKDKTDVKIIGSSLCADYLPPFERDCLTTWEGNVITANEAFEQAGLERGDIDFAEIHDAFTIVELLAYEDVGFCKKGEAYKLIRDGYFKIDGKMPVNVSGGLKAKGHPISATGVGMIYEILKQMRGEAGDRQLSKVRNALAHNIGGAGGTTVAHILKKIGGV